MTVVLRSLLVARGVKLGVVMFVLALTLRFAVAIVLAVAAYAKARSFDTFRQTVSAIVPWHRGVSAIAGAVIATEAMLAGLLTAGVLASAVAAATLALFLAFAALSLWAARRGLRVECNCFGRGERELGKDTLVTSVMLAGATLAYLILLGSVEGSLSPGEAPLAAGLGVGAVLAGRWLLVAGDLAAMIRQRRRLDRELEAGATAQ